MAEEQPRAPGGAGERVGAGRDAAAGRATAAREARGGRATAAREAMGGRATAAREATSENIAAARDAAKDAVAAIKPKLRGVSHEWAFFTSLGLGAALSFAGDTTRATLPGPIYRLSP